MITVRVKYSGKYINVSVVCKECKKYDCFVPHKYVHKKQSMDGKSMDWINSYYSCANNDYHGCPDNPKNRK
jgi:hypothetical protein